MNALKASRMPKRFFILILLFIIILSGTVIAGSFFLPSRALGEKQAKIKSTASNDAIATVNGKEISHKFFELTKATLEHSGQNKSNEQIIASLTENEALYQDATKHGYIVSEEDLSQFIEDQKKSLRLDDDVLKGCRTCGLVWA